MFLFYFSAPVTISPIYAKSTQIMSQHQWPHGFKTRPLLSLRKVWVVSFLFNEFAFFSILSRRLESTLSAASSNPLKEKLLNHCDTFCPSTEIWAGRWHLSLSAIRQGAGHTFRPFSYMLSQHWNILATLIATMPWTNLVSSVMHCPAGALHSKCNMAVGCIKAGDRMPVNRVDGPGLLLPGV